MDENVIARFVRDDGQELVVDETDWGALTINGADAASYEIFTEKKASGDGEYVTGSRVKSRNLEIAANVMDTENNEILRHRAVSFFNPKHSFRIYLTYMGATRFIDGLLSAFQCPAQYIHAKQKFSCFFLCADPYFNSVDDFGQDIASETPRWGFPYMDHPVYKTLVAVYNFERVVRFDYDGDVPTHFRAEITVDGEVVNPKLIKDGSFVRLLDTLQAGDTVEIDFEQAAIAKNGENVLAKVDRASDFTAMMTPGDNTISFDADTGENVMHVRLFYNKKYLGV